MKSGTESAMDLYKYTFNPIHSHSLALNYPLALEIRSGRIEFTTLYMVSHMPSVLVAAMQGRAVQHWP